MPLVTRTAVQGNVYRQAAAPSDWQNGDLWVDTDDGAVYVNISGTATGIVSGSASITINSITKTLEQWFELSL